VPERLECGTLQEEVNQILQGVSADGVSADAGEAQMRENPRVFAEKVQMQDISEGREKTSQ